MISSIVDSIKEWVYFTRWLVVARTIDQLDSPLLVQFYYQVICNDIKGLSKSQQLLSALHHYFDQHNITATIKATHYSDNRLNSDLIPHGDANVYIDLWYHKISWYDPKVKEPIRVLISPYPRRWKLGFSRPQVD